MSHELLKLIRAGQKPGELCSQCPAHIVNEEYTSRDGHTVFYEKEPCTSAFKRFKGTGKGSGLEPGEPFCLASLQAEANMTQGPSA